MINSTEGHVGGYVLARPAANITVNDILKALSGRLFDQEFCINHTGVMKICQQFYRLFYSFALDHSAIRN
ncbi:Rrf2 family transcriptional regulator [Gelidibacter algens]|uniref:Rrf2 family transcriptional regulator n=1 Tax=Gelidibacter algens TaxID=49280 RepID=UPI003743FB46